MDFRDLKADTTLAARRGEVIESLAYELSASGAASRAIVTDLVDAQSRRYRD